MASRRHGAGSTPGSVLRASRDLDDPRRPPRRDHPDRAGRAAPADVRSRPGGGQVPLRRQRAAQALQDARHVGAPPPRGGPQRRPSGHRLGRLRGVQRRRGGRRGDPGAVAASERPRRRRRPRRHDPALRGLRLRGHRVREAEGRGHRLSGPGSRGLLPGARGDAGTGTRHGAAYRIVSALKDALCIVVSQDGGVRFVRWHAGSVTYWDQVAAQTFG
ncbi:MAG: DNA integrity scanning protein DisA nucleotide-binding domain protein [Polyangiaceae bacterium]|nr:DNA integrity scanning protein DisA nucleotide-binding domain protein [Polyangiaceae bacterium]